MSQFPVSALTYPLIILMALNYSLTLKSSFKLYFNKSK